MELRAPPFFPPLPGNSERTVTREAVALGRKLFHDPILSPNLDLSCSSCHKQKFAFGDSTRITIALDGSATQRNVPPLMNLSWYEAFGWDGRAPTIEDQVLIALREEHGIDWSNILSRIESTESYHEAFYEAYGNAPLDSTQIADAIAQFLRTLVSYRSKYDRVLAMQEQFTEDEYRGFVLVNDQSMADCLHCHVTDAHALGTTGGFSNNGLDDLPTDPGLSRVTNDPRDMGRFKIPTLRNVGVTAPYMHDGRFATLEEVLDHYEHVKDGPTVDPKMAAGTRKGIKLTRDERCQIIAFLHTLTDTVFLNDPSFATP
jgi:cytochrome c peroxidase